MFRVMTGIDKVESATWFSPAQEKQEREGAMATRASSGMLNVNRNRGGTEVRNNFWSVRVVDSWNSLPDSVKSSASINIFKNSIDNLIEGGKI